MMQFFHEARYRYYMIKKGWQEIHYSLANNNKGELTNQVNYPDKIHHISLRLWRWIKHRLSKVMNKSNEISILAWATLTGTIIFNLITFVWHDSWVQTIYCLRLSVMKVKNDHCSKFSNLSNGKKKPEKNQGFNGIRTRDLRVAGALLYQLSHEATHWERGLIYWVHISREEWNDVKCVKWFIFELRL